MKLASPGWPDRSGWYAIALFLQVIVYMLLYAAMPDLRTDEFFKVIGTALIVNGWILIAVGQAKGEKERENTGKALDLAKSSAPTEPRPVVVEAPASVVVTPKTEESPNG